MYAIRLSYNMIVALVDVSSGYTGEDSPRHNPKTRYAIETRRKLVTMDASKLTKKGKAYLEMALYEYANAKANIASRKAAPAAAATAKRRRAA